MMNTVNCDYEQHNEHSSATKCGEFLDRNIEKDSASLG
jgi:hypothetical protein